MLEFAARDKWINALALSLFLLQIRPKSVDKDMKRETVFGILGVLLYTQPSVLEHRRAGISLYDAAGFL